MLTNIMKEITLRISTCDYILWSFFTSIHDLFYKQNYDLSNIGMILYIFIDQSELYLSILIEIAVKLWIL